MNEKDSEGKIQEHNSEEYQCQLPLKDKLTNCFGKAINILGNIFGFCIGDEMSDVIRNVNQNTRPSSSPLSLSPQKEISKGNDQGIEQNGILKSKGLDCGTKAEISPLIQSSSVNFDADTKQNVNQAQVLMAANEVTQIGQRSNSEIELLNAVTMPNARLMDIVTYTEDQIRTMNWSSKELKKVEKRTKNKTSQKRKIITNSQLKVNKQNNAYAITKKKKQQVKIQECDKHQKGEKVTSSKHDPKFDQQVKTQNIVEQKQLKYDKIAHINDNLDDKNIDKEESCEDNKTEEIQKEFLGSHKCETQNTVEVETQTNFQESIPQDEKSLSKKTALDVNQKENQERNKKTKSKKSQTDPQEFISVQLEGDNLEYIRGKTFSIMLDPLMKKSMGKKSQTSQQKKNHQSDKRCVYLPLRRMSSSEQKRFERMSSAVKMNKTVFVVVETATDGQVQSVPEKQLSKSWK